MEASEGIDSANKSVAYSNSLKYRQLICNWSGPAFIVLFFIGLIPFMEFVPPQSPLYSGDQIANIYTENLTKLRIGTVLCSISVALLASWGAAIAVRTKRTEREYPVYTYTQIICVAVGTMVAVFCFLIWAVAAFRPGDISPDITLMLNDIGWFLFLFSVPPFMLWMAVVGLAILTNRSEYRLMPRWVGYFSLWCAIGESPALLIVFFKDGPFAFNGLFGFWIPLIVFFLWILVLALVLHIEITREWQDTRQQTDRT